MCVPLESVCLSVCRLSYSQLPPLAILLLFTNSLYQSLLLPSSSSCLPLSFYRQTTQSSHLPRHHHSSDHITSASSQSESCLQLSHSLHCCSLSQQPHPALHLGVISIAFSDRALHPHPSHLRPRPSRPIPVISTAHCCYTESRHHTSHLSVSSLPVSRRSLNSLH